MKKYEALGTTDSVNACDCCGRTGLKKTVVMHESASGEYLHFGTTCAARASGWTVTDVKKRAATGQTELINKFAISVFTHPEYQQMEEEISEWNKKGPGGDRPYAAWQQTRQHVAALVLAQFPEAEQAVLRSHHGPLAGVYVNQLSGIDSKSRPA